MPCIIDSIKLGQAIMRSNNCVVNRTVYGERRCKKCGVLKAYRYYPRSTRVVAGERITSYSAICKDCSGHGTPGPIAVPNLKTQPLDSGPSNYKLPLRKNMRTLDARGIGDLVATYGEAANQLLGIPAIEQRFLGQSNLVTLYRQLEQFPADVVNPLVRKVRYGHSSPRSE